MAGGGSKDRKIYYGWIVVATGFAIWTVAFGIQYSFGIFFKPLQETFGWSRAVTSWAMTIHLVVFALSMVPAGWAIDRFNTRVVFSIAALLIGSSLILCSRISQPWQLYLLYGLPLGIGVSICGPAIMASITRWFIEKRGLALGITSAGVGFGTLAAAPLSNLLIVSYGWRNTFIILGIAACIILLVCACYIKVSPQPVTNRGGSAVAKSKNNNQALKPSSLRGMTLGQAIRTREIFLILLAQGFIGFTLRVVMVHIAPHATDKGISPSVAALAIGTIGGVSILGRLVMGFVQDRIGAQRSMLICLSIQGVSMLALPFINSDLLFFAFAIVFGFTYGGDIPQTPALTAQCFGVASIGVIYGLVQTVGNLAGALGPIVAGYIFDLTGNYTPVFLGAAGGLFVAIICISRLKLRNK